MRYDRPIVVKYCAGCKATGNNVVAGSFYPSLVLSLINKTAYMFTGIIEETGLVQKIEEEGSNRHFYISAPMAADLRPDESVAHNGVCLTVVENDSSTYKVTAVEETLRKSNLADLQVGDRINLERSMVANGRFDGHIVQGHVDTVAVCKSIEERQGSWLFTFHLPEPTRLLVEKGSVAVNGISLTCFEVQDDAFTVAVIPYTYEHTNLGTLQPDDRVNIEFDIIGKYVARLLG